MTQYNVKMITTTKKMCLRMILLAMTTVWVKWSTSIKRIFLFNRQNWIFQFENGHKNRGFQISPHPIDDGLRGWGCSRGLIRGLKRSCTLTRWKTYEGNPNYYVDTRWRFFCNVQSVLIPFSVKLYVLVNNLLNIINTINRILLCTTCCPGVK